MNSSETLDLIKTLKACGAVHFKSHDLEVRFDSAVTHEPLIQTPSTVASPAQAQPSSIENPEATEKLKELIKTMSLPPEQLVDVIFPNGAGA